MKGGACLSMTDAEMDGQYSSGYDSGIYDILSLLHTLEGPE